MGFLDSLGELIAGLLDVLEDIVFGLLTIFGVPALIIIALIVVAVTRASHKQEPDLHAVTVKRPEASTAERSLESAPPTEEVSVEDPFASERSVEQPAQQPSAETTVETAPLPAEMPEEATSELAAQLEATAAEFEKLWNAGSETEQLARSAEKQRQHARQHTLRQAFVWKEILDKPKALKK